MRQSRGAIILTYQKQHQHVCFATHRHKARTLLWATEGEGCRVLAGQAPKQVLLEAALKLDRVVLLVLQGELQRKTASVPWQIKLQGLVDECGACSAKFVYKARQQKMQAVCTPHLMRHEFFADPP